MRFFYSVLRGLFVNSQLINFRRAQVRMASVDLSGMRTAYKCTEEAFTEDQLVSQEPIAQFTSWFEEVKKCPEIIEPNAMCVATCDKNGSPSSRMVLLKGYGPDGFKFFTNYESRKGCDLAENPKAALLFYWPPFNRQVRIEGRVSKTSEEESKTYFEKRPLKSRVSAFVSPQSQPIPSRKFLEEASEKLLAQGDVKRPSFWGGYSVLPESVEFWQGQTDRLHDRFVYTRLEGDQWKIQRIAP